MLRHILGLHDAVKVEMSPSSVNHNSFQICTKPERIETEIGN